MQFITWRPQEQLSEIILHDEPIPYMAAEPTNETKGKNKGLTILSHPFAHFSQFCLINCPIVVIFLKMLFCWL